MQTEIAGININYKDADDLKEKVRKALNGVLSYLEEVEKERSSLRTQKRMLQKFLGVENVK